MEERWIIVDEFPDYEISDRGRLCRIKTGRILKPSLIKDGYLLVSIRKDRQTHSRKIHRLVAEAFCYGYRPGLVVNHLDGNKTNNDWWNLEWTTLSENSKHAHRTGLVSNKTPIRIVETGEIFDSQLSCAQAIGGSLSGINNMLRGRSSHHLGYTFEYVD